MPEGHKLIRNRTAVAEWSTLARVIASRDMLMRLTAAAFAASAAGINAESSKAQFLA